MNFFGRGISPKIGEPLRIVERGWDEQDVRTALRKSSERRDVVRGTRNLTDADMDALIAALREVPASPNLVPADQLLGHAAAH